MQKQIGQLYSKYRNFVLYGIIGLISAGLDFVIYTSLIQMGVVYLLSNIIGIHLSNIIVIHLSNIIGIHCGIFCSFILNRYYNFKVKDNVFYRFLSFYAVGLLGLLVSSGLLWLLVTKIAWNEIHAKLITIIVVAIFQFIVNKFITFRKINKNK
jgi:putative flippase GtrA